MAEKPMLYRGKVGDVLFRFGKASLRSAERAELVDAVHHDTVLFFQEVTVADVERALVKTEPLRASHTEERV